MNLALSADDFLFIFLQLWSDVAFAICKRLLANPVLRHLVLVCVSYLKIIAKHIVETYLQTLNARYLTLPLLNLEQIVFSRECYLAQFVKFCRHTIGNDITLGNEQRR